MDNKILDLAKILFKNTEKDDLKGEILSYIIDPARERRNLHKVLKCILKDGYPMFKFELFEIPHPRVYTFVSKDVKHESFDVCLISDLKEVYISFLDGSSSKKTGSILEAIQRYRWEE